MSLNWLRGAPLVILSLAALLLSGCVTIEVIDRTPSMPEPATPTGEDRAQEHDLAVLAVDFDPPLEYEEIVAQKNRGEGITLLVAVENTGIHTERDVTVEVVLSSDNGMTVYLQKQGSIAAIAPGEIKIIHFEDTEIPFSYKYTLWVRAVPVLGETRLGDNQKSYDLLITQP
ncbi:MAG: hypothetical protein ISS56_06620 [Anaerolineae bacterium]|nr:hypothetical protein [Anaerolineae bacterium]